MNVLRRVLGLRCSSLEHMSVGTGLGYPVPEEEELRGELQMFLLIFLSSLLPPGQQGGSVCFVCIPAEICWVFFYLSHTMVKARLLCYSSFREPVFCGFDCTSQITLFYFGYNGIELR